MKFLIPVFLLLAQSSAWALTTQWTPLSTEKDVEVFRGEIPGSPVVAFKGRSKIDAPIEKVLSVIYDTSRAKEWLSDLKEIRVLEKKNKFNKIEYNRTAAPWPVSDRDFVYSVEVQLNEANRAVEIFIQSTTHPAAPSPEGVVRGELHLSRYYLQSLDAGQATSIEVEILADPKGSLPKWMVNLVQRSWPVNTITGIRKIALDNSFPVHPDVAEAMPRAK